MAETAGTPQDPFQQPLLKAFVARDEWERQFHPRVRQDYWERGRRVHVQPEPESHSGTFKFHARVDIGSIHGPQNARAFESAIVACFANAGISNVHCRVLNNGAGVSVALRQEQKECDITFPRAMKKQAETVIRKLAALSRERELR